MLLLIDNYDSFTYNLLHYFYELGEEVKVVRNDALSAEEVIKGFEKGEYQGIVISPGPCDPDKAGICLDVIKQAEGRIPLFGVCLGHQSIAQAYGANIVLAPTPMHGKVSSIKHEGKDLFADLPDPLEVTRYHSLIVERDTLPDCFEITAETEDGIIMGLKHTEFPIHGVQFHPESIASQKGHELLNAFVEAL